MNTAVIVGGGNTLEYTIALWYDAKAKRSGSARTAETYRATMQRFRWELQRAGLDLDGDPVAVATAAQGWAGLPWDSRRTVGPATFNQRLAVLSSFFSFALKRGVVKANPVALVERRVVHAYAGARAIDADTVADRLAAIDRSGPAGLRDWCILGVALYTGRRISEVNRLARGDLQWVNGRAVVTFEHAKGGKSFSDKLPPPLSQAIADYIARVHGPNMAADARLWVSFSNRHFGKPISNPALRAICERHLGTSKFHRLRSTFAAGMEGVGAKVSTIQHRLGHESLQTTGRYLAALESADNAHGAALAERFGIGN